MTKIFNRGSIKIRAQKIGVWEVGLKKRGGKNTMKRKDGV